MHLWEAQKEKKKVAESLFEETMTPRVPNLREEMDTQIQEAQLQQG